MEVKIIPTGGLCNRLRAIATGVAVAKKYHCPSVIYWNNSLGLKADYCELFKPIPQDDIQRRIDEVVAGFSERTIGVHIRRTDNVVSIQSSPLENFTNMMDAEIKKNTNTKFYVASDDDEVKESLKSKYPNRIITLMDDTDRNSLEGMKFAVLDLFCLSKTNKIIGSVGSSYSQIAAEIGGIEVEYAK